MPCVILIKRIKQIESINFNANNAYGFFYTRRNETI